MEVHHPHHPTHKKKWSEYLLEFFMLFLAVFLGFAAESYREHIGEHAKERAYMHSMMTDLQKDTATMNFCIRGLSYEISGHDSLENRLENPINDPEYNRKLYYLNTAFTWADIGVRFAEGTFTELKSTGSLRLIEKSALTDSILEYESMIEGCKGQHDYVRESISKTYFFATDIFDISCCKTYNDFINKGNFVYNITIPYGKIRQYICADPKLLTNDVNVLKKYSRLVNNEKDQMAAYLFHVENANKIAARLIEAIKEEYNFR